MKDTKEIVEPSRPRLGVGLILGFGHSMIFKSPNHKILKSRNPIHTRPRAAASTVAWLMFSLRS